MRRHRAGTLALAGAAALALSGVARADSVSFDSTTDPFIQFESSPGSFTGTWTYTGVNANSGTLTLGITNTTSVVPGGAITAIAFNKAAGTTVSLSMVINDDETWAAATAIPPPNYVGNFDSVFTVGGAAFPAAGSGRRGVEVGEGEVTFTWAINASGDGLTLSVVDFLDFENNSKGFGFVVKMKGIGPDDVSDTIGFVPLPAALPMGLVGLAGIVVLRRRWAARQLA